MLEINWQQVMLNIRASGMALTVAAKIVGSDWQHLNRLARGEVQQPRFLTGMKILDLHLDRCPEKHTWERLT